jgi:hypothetical protein
MNVSASIAEVGAPIARPSFFFEELAVEMKVILFENHIN